MSLATLLDRNKAFAATGAVAKNPQIPWLPSQLCYIITCIDSRTEPAAILGVDLGDATVQRTVGGRVTPAPATGDPLGRLAAGFSGLKTAIFDDAGGRISQQG
jgi:carbonic anhydrase